MFLSAAHDPEQAGRAALLVAVQTRRCMETPHNTHVNALAAIKASCSSRLNTRGMSNFLSSVSMT
eukprot:8903784-Pyramimonas_sp.AAC.1